jgi:small-conductance mechanosensitive channel
MNFFSISHSPLNEKMIFDFLHLENFSILSFLILGAWSFYKIFLRNVSEERHQRLRSQFRSLFKHYILLTLWLSGFWLLREQEASLPLARALPWIGLIGLIWGFALFVRTCRITLLQYLFRGSMQAGVPVLIVNIFSLLMSLLILLWVLNKIFAINLAPMLATSAAFSIILGLAMQDTLGNIFAGISLQIDQSFEIGHWLEVTVGNQKIVGQVKEISWRATVLIGWSDELITLPNRTLANAQIANFSASGQPIYRGLNFKLPLDVDLEKARKIMLNCIEQVDLIPQLPEAICYVNETTDSWVSLRIAYPIEQFGKQFVIGDKVTEMILRKLQSAGIKTAHQTVEIRQLSALS